MNTGDRVGCGSPGFAEGLWAWPTSHHHPYSRPRPPSLLQVGLGRLRGQVVLGAPAGPGLGLEGAEPRSWRAGAQWRGSQAREVRGGGERGGGVAGAGRGA